MFPNMTCNKKYLEFSCCNIRELLKRTISIAKYLIIALIFHCINLSGINMVIIKLFATYIKYTDHYVLH